MRPFIESLQGMKEKSYNTMIKHFNKLLKALENNGNIANKHDYGIEYIGTEYEKDTYNATSRIGYVDKRFSYSTKIGRDENRFVEIADFIGDTTIDFSKPEEADPKCACAIIERTVHNLKRFYLDYIYKSNSENNKLTIEDVKFGEDEFRQKCRHFLRSIETRSINGNFNANNELEKFRKDVSKLVLQEIGIDNSYNRGRKIEIAFNVKLMYDFS